MEVKYRMKKKANNKRIKAPTCPYCGSTAVLRDASFVYHDKCFKSHLYVCARYPECDSYVGVHEGTLRPEGTLANSELRNRRIRAHKAFDQIWRTGIMTRPNAYRWMMEKMQLTQAQAHIGMFSEYRCDQLIELCNKVLHDCKRMEVA